MSSTFSNLKFELITTGEQSGAWGNTTNTNIGTAIEQAIVGMATLTSSDFTTNVATLTLTNTNTAQNARALCLVVSASSLSAAGTINVPAIQKPYLIINNDSFAVTVKVSGLTGVSVPAGKRTLVYNNGTDVGNQVDYLASLALGTALPLTSGGTGGTSAATARTSLGSTTVGSNLFTLANPSAVTFMQINADNTVTTLDAASFRTAIGAGSGGGTVTSVTGTAPISVLNGTTTPAISMTVATASANGYLTSTDWTTFNNKGSGTVTSVSGTNPVLISTGTTTPVVSLATGYGDTQNPYANKTGNYVLAAPNGVTGAPSFRALVAADIPTLNQNTTGTAAGLSSILAVASGGTGTATPSLVAGTNVTISGTWPNQTVNASGGGGSGTVTSVSGTGSVNGITLSGTVTSSGNLTLGGTLSNVNLTSQVTGTLPVGNGGTGVTTSTGSGSNVLSNSPTLVTPALGTPSSGNLANCTFPTLNQNTTGSSGSISNSGGWSVTPSGTKLYFNYNGTNVGSLDSSGNFIALGNVTAYGTP